MSFRDDRCEMVNEIPGRHSPRPRLATRSSITFSYLFPCRQLFSLLPHSVLQTFLPEGNSRNSRARCFLKKKNRIPLKSQEKRKEDIRYLNKISYDLYIRFSRRERRLSSEKNRWKRFGKNFHRNLDEC